MFQQVMHPRILNLDGYGCEEAKRQITAPAFEYPLSRSNQAIVLQTLTTHFHAIS